MIDVDSFKTEYLNELFTSVSRTQKGSAMPKYDFHAVYALVVFQLPYTCSLTKQTNKKITKIQFCLVSLMLHIPSLQMYSTSKHSLSAQCISANGLLDGGPT